MKLWYTAPAAKWIDGMPLGNGRMGAIVQGKLRNETVGLNDDTLWTGERENRNNPDALKYLEEVRSLLLQGNVEKAHALAEAAMIGIPKNQATYQTMGELSLQFTDHVDDSMELFREGHALEGVQQAMGARVESYERSLLLDEAIARVQYTIDGVHYTREFFISQPDGVLVVKLSASHKGCLNLMATLFRKLDATTHVREDHLVELTGSCGVNGSRFCTLLHVQASGGTMSPIGSNLFIENADEIILRVACETNVRCEEYQKACENRLLAAAETPYNVLWGRHLAEYQGYFSRMRFALEEDNRLGLLPTNERLAHVRQGGRDLGLIALYFHFGRYLLVASSRPGSMPANLQGIWCDSFTPPWDSKYTLNINTQMNYWAAESCNLSECHEPLFDLLEKMQKKGRRTAKEMYGCEGFVAHHNTDLGADTAPLDHTRAGLWPMGAAWLCYHLWQHYEYTLDITFLRDRAYPILCEATRFFLGYLFEDKDGHLLSGPSLSPENRFVTPDKQIGYLCLSPAMDIQILLGLFERCCAAAEALGIDDTHIRAVRAAQARLLPLQIDKNGVLQEWSQPYAEAEPGHRHVSHLFGIYPGCDITKNSSMELFEAARKALHCRMENGGGATGWSTAWNVALLARFGEGDAAGEALQTLLSKLTADSLLDIHPHEIFQIDGNLGAIAGIVEMLVQEEDGKIVLLPALPDDWESGQIEGLRLKGGLTLALAWRADHTATVSFTASHACLREIYLKEYKSSPVVTITLQPGQKYTTEIC